MPNAKMSSSRYQHSIKQDAHPLIVTSLLRFASLSSSADAACAMRNTHEQFTVRLPGCVSMNSSLARALSSSLSHKRGRGGKPNFRAYLGWYQKNKVAVICSSKKYNILYYVICVLKIYNAATPTHHIKITKVFDQ